MPTSSSAAVITETIQVSLGGSALAGERPRMSETQTEVSSRCNMHSVEIQVALLRLDRAFEVGEVGTLRKVLPHVTGDVVQRLEFRLPFGLEDDFIAALFDDDFGAFETK